MPASLDQRRGDAFDEGAQDHLRGEPREVPEAWSDQDVASAWLAGWDASAFFGLSRDKAVR